MLRGSYFLVNLGPLGRLGPLGQIYGTNLSSKLQSLKGPNRLKGPKEVIAKVSSIYFNF